MTTNKPTAFDRAVLLARLEVCADDDISRVRETVSRQAKVHGLSELDRTRLVTATSELVRNMLTYAGGGEVRLERLEAHGDTLLRVAFDDVGPGIGDIEAALVDGFSTGRGLGLGLGGARRLVDEFAIESTPGGGTRIAITRRCALPR